MHIVAIEEKCCFLLFDTHIFKQHNYLEIICVYNMSKNKSNKFIEYKFVNLYYTLVFLNLFFNNYTKSIVITLVCI